MAERKIVAKRKLHQIFAIKWKPLTISTSQKLNENIFNFLNGKFQPLFSRVASIKLDIQGTEKICLEVNKLN